MWIFMLDTYAGGIGTFPKGHKLDLPPDIIERIPKDCYEKTCAPWDEQKDTKKIKLTQAEAKAKEAQIWAGLLQDKADEAKQKADQLVSPASQKQSEADAAKAAADKAVKAAEKQNASKEIKKQAFQLARLAEREDLEFQKAHGELVVAIAEAGLKQFEVDDAKKQAERAARVVEQLKNKAAKKKTEKEKDNAKSEAGQSVGEPVDKSVGGSVGESVDKTTDEQIDGVTEGQADEAGKAG